MMDGEKIKNSAENLYFFLNKYSSIDSSAKECLDLLLPYIRLAKDNQIDSPITRLPCAYAMHEGELRRYPDLEKAYSTFSLNVRGYNREDMIDRIKNFDPNIKI